LLLDQPATRWEDALPAGNGTVGALVYGSLSNETVILNREDLWLPLFGRPTVPDMAPHLPRYRELLEAGQFKQADQFWRKSLRREGWPEILYTNPFCVGFDLRLEQAVPGAFTQYRRRLDFDTGEAQVMWRAGGAAFARRLFVSRADDLVVLSITGPRGGIDVGAAFAPHPLFEDNRKTLHYPRNYTRAELPLDIRASARAAWLLLDARFTPGGGFGAVAKVITRGGRVTCDGQSVAVAGADEVLILARIFRGRATAGVVRQARAAINAARPDYAALLRRHTALHRTLYRRVELDLAAGRGADQTNEKLLTDAYQGRVANALTERMANYGRYLSIASTNRRGLPPNLQGVWNGDVLPAWSSDYTQDENVQMMHWQVLPGNLPELMEPYFRYFESTLKDWRTNARRFFGCRGVLAPLRQSDNGLLPENMPYLMFTAGAGWLAQPFYDYWLFTGDRTFLRDRAVPFLKQVALFYEDFLYPAADGTLTVCPSMSPENVPDVPGATLVAINPTMDVAVCREVLTNLCRACRELGIEPAGVRRWEGILRRLPAYAVNEDGAMKEWLRPELKDNYRHRHLSHIYPLFPGNEISRESNPALFEACRIAVRKRLVIGIKSQTGWSLAHMANIYARLEEGDKALECLDLIARACTGPNLWTYHNDWRKQGITMDTNGLPPFQMDANLGLSAAVLEMLAFSVPGLVKLLPALPARWQRGRVSGLACRGQVELAVEWDVPARALRAWLKSAVAQTLTLRAPAWAGRPRAMGRAGRVQPSSLGAAYVSVTLPAHRSVELRFTPAR
jgi:alpha-L-fucosidase 2